jgi:hypothetical protein
MYVPLAAVSWTGFLGLLGFIFFGLMVYAGYLNKLYAATVTLFMTVFSVLVSLTFFQPLAQVVMNAVSWSEQVAYGVMMMLLFLGTYIGCYAVATAKLPARLEGLPKSIAGVGGALMGVLTGVVFSGFMLVALYLFPLAVAERQKEAFLGADQVVVKLAGVFHNRIPWQPFEPAQFLHWAKTVNIPKVRPPATDSQEPGAYPRPGQ